jgi:hypothetical protein
MKSSKWASLSIAFAPSRHRLAGESCSGHRKSTGFCGGYQDNQITVIYDTMYNGTQMLAENIVKGITMADPLVNVKLFSASILI